MSDDVASSEDLNFAQLEDDCKLLGSLLDRSLKLEVGEQLFAKIEKIRSLAQCAATLSQKGDTVASGLLSNRMADELMSLTLDEALPLTRACGHYSNLTAIAEQHHTIRRLRQQKLDNQACDEVFAQLIAEGVEPDKLYDAVTNQNVEVVLTAHPTQVNRRTLQYKHTKIAALLQQNDRVDLTKEERDAVIDDLVREVVSLWQTDELRRQKPTPLDEARGGLHIVEQSLWAAVPAYMRRLSAALKKHTGRDLPLFATPFKFGSWMGGDRDGNPNVIAKVTSHVVYLARWMAADMYLREIDALRFELSMSQCSGEVWRMAKNIIHEHSKRVNDAANGEGSVHGSSNGLDRLGGVRSALSAGKGHHKLTTPSQQQFPEGMVIGVRPDMHQSFTANVDYMPSVPGLLPGQDIEGGSECDFSVSDRDGPYPDSTPGTPSVNEFSLSKASSLSNVRENFDMVSPGLFKQPSETWRAENTDIVPPMLGYPSNRDMSMAMPSGFDRNVSIGMFVDRSASIGVSDPTMLRKSLRFQRAAAEMVQFRRTHDHQGFHPYRIILGDVREKLMSTRKRYEDMLNHREPNPDEPWYETEEELETPLRAIYWSLYECGAGVVADGRLLDLIRRISVFGMSLMKLDIRQESSRHSDAINAITTYLGYGAYLEWDEDQKLEFLTRELQGRRPLIPPDMPLTEEVKEVLDTCRVIAQLGPKSLAAYVISMTKAASDVLAVELLQREAMFQVCAEQGSVPDLTSTLRVVPLFETLEDLEGAGAIMTKLLSNPWYRSHIEKAHNNHQEVMLGYSDSGKDAGRLAANWALYKCQEQLVAITKDAGVKLTLFHGRGGTVGRGGGPTHLAIRSQPPGSVEGGFRITEQGEMVMAKFGITPVAQHQMEIYTTAVLLASLRPPSPPKFDRWRDTMEALSVSSCEAYRSVVFKHPHFISYFKHATPEAELGNLNIGSRPSRRRADNAGINTLRAIPWQFAWTQTRLILPSWLGVGDALLDVIKQGSKSELKHMYQEWPFFQATIDLIEMILAKSDVRIASLYEEVLVDDPNEQALGAELRQRLLDTNKAILEVTGHRFLLEANPSLKRLIEMRNPFIDPINVLQVEILRRLRQDPNNPRLRDALLISINGIAAGMRNTG